MKPTKLRDANTGNLGSRIRISFETTRPTSHFRLQRRFTQLR
ncbi:hypothetical protein ABIE52_000040 [Rhodococcus sp. OAS809]|jgi:hypothetical protein